MSYWTSNAAKYIGSAPETSGSTADYANLMSAIAGMAITVLNNLGVSYAWSAITLAAAIRNVVDSTSNNNTGLTRDWEWSSDVSDVGQYFWFLVDVNAGKQVKFSTDYCRQISEIREGAVHRELPLFYAHFYFLCAFALQIHTMDRVIRYQNIKEELSC